MIQIHKSKLPDFLINSCYYRSVFDDDCEHETISALSKCTYLANTVSNFWDFCHLIRTIMYWGVDKPPTMLYDYCNIQRAGDISGIDCCVTTGPRLTVSLKTLEKAAKRVVHFRGTDLYIALGCLIRTRTCRKNIIHGIHVSVYKNDSSALFDYILRSHHISELQLGHISKSAIRHGAVKCIGVLNLYVPYIISSISYLCTMYAVILGKPEMFQFVDASDPVRFKMYLSEHMYLALLIDNVECFRFMHINGGQIDWRKYRRINHDVCDIERHCVKCMQYSTTLNNGPLSMFNAIPET